MVKGAHFQIGAGGIPTAEISPSFWISGGHFRSLADVRLDKLTCELTHLVEWVGHDSYSFTFEKDFSAMRLDGRKPDLIACAIIDDVEVFWSPSLVVTPANLSMTFRNDCRLHLRAKEAQPYEKFGEIVNGIAELIALATERPVYITQVKGQTPDNEDRTIEVFRRLRRRDPAKNLRRGQFLFTLLDVQQAGTDFVTRFFARRTQFRPVLEVLLSDHYNSEVYQHQRFLSLAHGIEAFHRVFIGGKYTTDDEHEKNLLPLLIATLPRDLNPDFRRSLKNKFKFLNEYSLRKRIADVGLRFESALTNLIPDIRAFADEVANARNSLSHPDASSSLYDTKNRDLWLMSEQLSLLLELCLVKKLGLGPAVIERIITTGRHAEAIRLNLPGQPA